MKNSTHTLLLLSAMIPSISHSMQYPLSVIKGCRPVVRAVCYQRKLDLEVVHHIAKQHAQHEAIPYLTAVVDGYKKIHGIEDFTPPVTMQQQLQTELLTSIRSYRALSYTKGCAAFMLAPTAFVATIGCGACAAVGTAITPALLIMSILEYEKFSDIVSYAAGTFVGVPALIMITWLLTGTTGALAEMVETNIFNNQKLVRENIKRNTDILERYIQQERKEDL